MNIAAGITPSFEGRAKPFLDSAYTHGINPIVICVDYPVGPPDFKRPKVPKHLTERFRCLNIAASKVICPVPNKMLQHGAFTQLFPDAHGDEVFVFVDADAVWQRPMSDVEIGMLDCPHGQFMAGRNNPDETQTLAHEATLLSPKISESELLRLFPGHDKMLCRNWGFVSATLQTWRELYRGVTALWPFTERAFANPAMVQWISCYVAQLDHKLVDLPLFIHAHGHRGIPPGLHKLDDKWFHEMTEVLYAHAL